uniref:RNase H type-1 domain-containing protein n=1 Tax=Oryza brachyantha TaxID=4533 RepID=J3N237_ORYBR
MKEKFQRKIAYVTEDSSNSDQYEAEIGLAKWTRNKKPITCPCVKGGKKEEKFDHDIDKANKIFDLLLQEKHIQMPAAHVIPLVEELKKKRARNRKSVHGMMSTRTSRSSSIAGNKEFDCLTSKTAWSAIPMNGVVIKSQTLGPMNREEDDEEDIAQYYEKLERHQFEIRQQQCCLSGLFTKNQKKKATKASQPKPGKTTEDLVKTNMVLKDFGDNSSEAKVLKGRMGKWILALTEYDLKYESAKAVNMPILYFNTTKNLITSWVWNRFNDNFALGACFEFAYMIKPYRTNHHAEYEALIKGLQLLKEIGAEVVEVIGDSQLVIKQLSGEYECRDDILKTYFEACKELAMVELPKTHRGQGMGHFMAELSRMAFTVGYPYEPEYTEVHRISGEFPHRKEIARLRGQPEPGGARLRLTARKRTRVQPRVQEAYSSPLNPLPPMLINPSSPTQSPQFGVASSPHAARNANGAGVTDWVTVLSSSPRAGVLKEVKLENS